MVAVGPDPDATASPLLGAAIRDGWLRPGPMGIAIDVDPATGRVLDASGEPTLSAYAMGALRKGVLWETIAIPEIRDQAADDRRRRLLAVAGERRDAPAPGLSARRSGSRAAAGRGAGNCSLTPSASEIDSRTSRSAARTAISAVLRPPADPG